MSSALGNLPANADYAALLPFSVVALAPLLILFVDLFFRSNGTARRSAAVGIATVALVVAGIAVHREPSEPTEVTEVRHTGRDPALATRE